MPDLGQVPALLRHPISQDHDIGGAVTQVRALDAAASCFQPVEQ